MFAEPVAALMLLLAENGEVDLEGRFLQPICVGRRTSKGNVFVLLVVLIQLEVQLVYGH